jgi:hypothetical protein
MQSRNFWVVAELFTMLAKGGFVYKGGVGGDGFGVYVVGYKRKTWLEINRGGTGGEERGRGTLVG